MTDQQSLLQWRKVGNRNPQRWALVLIGQEGEWPILFSDTCIEVTAPNDGLPPELQNIHAICDERDEWRRKYQELAKTKLSIDPTDQQIDELIMQFHAVRPANMAGLASLRDIVRRWSRSWWRDQQECANQNNPE